MKKSKRKLLFLMGAALCSIIFVSSIVAAVWLGAISEQEIAPGSSVQTLIVWMIVCHCLLAASSIGTITFFLLAEYSSRKSRWAKRLFGTEEIEILDEFGFQAAFKSAQSKCLRRNAKLLLKKDRANSSYIVALSLSPIREDADGVIKGQAFHSMNLLVAAKLKQAFSQKGDFYGVNERGDFFIYCESSEAALVLMKDRFTRFASELQTAFELRNDLPSVSVLFGAAKGEKKEPSDVTMAHSEFALGHNTARLSGSMEIYSLEMQKESEESKTFDQEIQRALSNKEFQIYYQAKWDIKAKGFYGAEALIRWRHPTRGILPPSYFIPRCENSRSIIDIDHYVFEAVCKDLAKWKNEGRRKIVVSVNLSRRSVYDPNLIQFLTKTIEDNRISPSSIDIELTESLASGNTVFISSMIRKIRSRGFVTSMDDFGVGMSSLSALKNIPFSVLKIDKSFIDDIEIDPKSRQMVRSIIDLVHALNMKAIAEGVETRDQAKILEELGLDAIQGYYFSKPLERARFESFLEDNIFEVKKVAERKATYNDPTRR